MSGNVHINTELLQQECAKKLEECIWGLEDCQEAIEKCIFPPDGAYQTTFTISKSLITQTIETLFIQIKKDIAEVNGAIDGFNNAEQKNKEIAGRTGGRGSNIPTVRPEETDSEMTDVEDIEENVNVHLEENEIQADAPTDVEISDEEQDIGLEEIVPNTQLEEVIDLIYDGEPNLTDEEKQRIIEAIAKINKTEILEGLDEDIANRIRAEIIKDYLDGELELDGIEKEQLQVYIESHPDLQIRFEINEAILSFESLIEGGVVTQEEIKAIIENNIEIHDENAFIEEYIDAGGLEADVSEVESFYDPETNIIHLRDTADSVVITNSIITILGQEVNMGEESTGDSVVEDVQIGESDTTIEMPNDVVDGSENMTDVELDENNTTIQMPDDVIDGSENITDVEINEDETNENQ